MGEGGHRQHYTATRALAHGIRDRQVPWHAWQAGAGGEWDWGCCWCVGSPRRLEWLGFPGLGLKSG